MKKSDVEFHNEYYRPSYPAINVKVYAHLHKHVSKIIARFKCSEEQAEAALNFAYESAQQDFWERAKEKVKEIFPEATMYSEGRSGGWLTVHGLQDVESWDAVMLAKWTKLDREIKAEIKYLCSEESMLNAIEANKWYLDGSEQ